MSWKGTFFLQAEPFFVGTPQVKFMLSLRDRIIMGPNGKKNLKQKMFQRTVPGENQQKTTFTKKY
jgi:hypothetical protein